MTQVISSYLATRLSVLASRLVRLEDIPDLIDYDLDTLLKQLPVEVSDKPNVLQLHNALISNALQDFNMLFRPFNGVEKDFLNFTVHWYELSNLKTLIRGKFTGTSDRAIRQELINLERFNQLPLDKLLEADDANEMMRLLEQTPYSSIVRQARAIYQEEGQNLFALDAAIDRQFFTGVAQRIRFLDHHDRQELDKIFGKLMDRLNLLWLIRYRFFYGLSPAKSFFLLATTGKKIHTGNLMQLAKLDSIEELILQLPEPLNSLLENRTNLTEIENLMEFYVISAAAKAVKHSPSVLTRLFSYILIKESEIQLFHAILKGKTLGIKEELIQFATGGNLH